MKEIIINLINKLIYEVLDIGLPEGQMGSIADPIGMCTFEFDLEFWRS